MVVNKFGHDQSTVFFSHKFIREQKHELRWDEYTSDVITSGTTKHSEVLTRNIDGEYPAMAK